MGIDIIDEKQLCHTTHRLLATAFTVHPQSDAEETIELVESPGEFQEMLWDFEV